MIRFVLCALCTVVPPAYTWLFLGCSFLLGSPVLAESERAFDGIELMSSGGDAAYHREKLLDRHNYLRSREAENGFGGGAVFMNRLTYDVELEAYARNYARYLCATGKWEHSQRQAPLRVARGENLYTTSADYSSVPSQNFDSAQIVQKWWEEREYFDWHSSHPSQTAQRQGKLVGHWTQVVRAETSTVGCWIVTGCQCKGGYCGKQNSGKWSTYVACHYDYGNLGYYPYWPLNPNIQYRTPSSVPNSRRKRCGNCPKGFSACGTTVGGGQKRDAYLCVGYWQVRAALPPADLLQQSIALRHSTAGVPSWYYMIRNCVRNNGSCPSDSACWKYDGGKVLTREPPVLVNQCQCNGFSTSAGIYFERDFCGRFSMVQPYYDADTFLGFSELKIERTVPNAEAELPITDTNKLLARLRPGYKRREPSAIETLKDLDYATVPPTPPLMEEAEESADLIIKSEHIAPGAQSSSQDNAAADLTRLVEQDGSKGSAKNLKPTLLTPEILIEEENSTLHPPSDDLMFEWRGALNPLSIARKPANDGKAEGYQQAQTSATRLQNIKVHNVERDFLQVRESTSPTVLQAEGLVEAPYKEEIVDTPAESRHPEQAEEVGARTLKQSSESDQDEMGQENLIPAPEGDLEDQATVSAGAPVDIPAVQMDARKKQMTPLDPSPVTTSPARAPEAGDFSSHPEEASSPPILAGTESTSATAADVPAEESAGTQATRLEM